MTSTQLQKNALFIRQFKRDNNVKVQTKLPSRVEADNAKAVTNGWSTIDATWFRRYMEEVKFDPVTHTQDVVLLFEMSRKCNSSPVGLINFGRCTYGWKQFGHDEIVYLKAHMLADLDDEPVVESPSEGSVEYEETSEPYNDNPNSEEAYAIDDDEQAAASASTSSRKRKVRSLAEPGDD